jgi:hypothetical protein
MKLRLQGNSVRLRLTRSEVQRLRDAGAVDESIDFGEETLSYRLESLPLPVPVEARFREGVLTVTLGKHAADAWADSNDVGVYAESGALVVSIEKDFRCLTRPLDERERDAYPHPGQQVEA